MVRRLEDIDKDFYNRECHIIGIGVDKYRYKDWETLKNCESNVEPEVKALKKTGIEVYYSRADFSKIYRK
jgi:hypothetical protein